MPRKRLTTVAGEGSRLATLEHLRQTLAAAIDAGPSPRDLAALSRRLMLVLEEIEQIGGRERTEKERRVDELRERRARRSAAS